MNTACSFARRNELNECCSYNEYQGKIALSYVSREPSIAKRDCRSVSVRFLSAHFWNKKASRQQMWFQAYFLSPPNRAIINHYSTRPVHNPQVDTGGYYMEWKREIITRYLMRTRDGAVWLTTDSVSKSWFGHICRRLISPRCHLVFYLCFCNSARTFSCC